MSVYHIVRKDDPRFAVRTVRNTNAAKMLLTYLGDEYEIVADLCTDVKLSKNVDVFTEHGYTMARQLRKDDASFC